MVIVSSYLALSVCISKAFKTFRLVPPFSMTPVQRKEKKWLCLFPCFIYFESTSFLSFQYETKGGQQTKDVRLSFFFFFIIYLWTNRQDQVSRTKRIHKNFWQLDKGGEYYWNRRVSDHMSAIKTSRKKNRRTSCTSGKGIQIYRHICLGKIRPGNWSARLFRGTTRNRSQFFLSRVV